MKSGSSTFKLVIGLFISVLFLYLAFGKIDLLQMKEAFFQANFWYFIPAVLVMFISHWLRSIRWQILLKSIKTVSVGRLFVATTIGYMGNAVLPAHMGELLRANVIARKENLATSSTLATIIIERIIDVFSLLIIMGLTLIVYPFPQTVTQSGYIMFVVVTGLLVFLVMLKKQHEKTMAFVRFFLRVLPESVAEKIEEMIVAFIEGINGMERKRDYVIIFVLSILVWGGYWANFQILCYAFNLFEIYHISLVSSLVLLVITTISVVVPSSPGYVGTYHYLCQLSLELLGVPSAVGLSFAFVTHALSTYPTALVGLFFGWREGMSRLNVKHE